VFTRNQFRAAPVWVAERHLASGAPRYLLINTGYANAGTGERGEADALACCRALAGHGQCGLEQVVPFSTGIIGEPLAVERIVAGIPAAYADLRQDGWEQAALAIHTTDTRPKQVSLQFELSTGACTITGIAKGAGMIRPNMATMLAFIATDAGLSEVALQRALDHSVGLSFNRISVDGDTSTNDACLLAATGAGASVAEQGGDFERFQAALDALCVDLARAIAADGEGASRLVEIEVCGARSSAEAEQVAFCVAESPLVKTALAAADPNWGRFLAAVGRAGVEDLDVSRVRLFFGDQLIAEAGGRSQGYDEASAAAELAGEQVHITIDLGRGGERATVWTCDLTAEYVRINAEYRT
jgi:glutamate N-acetyltransferase/amino-acid N-acetyltransferase